MWIKLIELLITGGYIAQLIITAGTGITVTILLIQQQPVPEFLRDLLFVIVGFYFHVAIQATSSRITSDKVRNGLLAGTKRDA